MAEDKSDAGFLGEDYPGIYGPSPTAERTKQEVDSMVGRLGLPQMGAS
jgi:hypothetical protein